MPNRMSLVSIASALSTDEAAGRAHINRRADDARLDRCWCDVRLILPRSRCPMQHRRDPRLGLVIPDLEHASGRLDRAPDAPPRHERTREDGVL
jgi:hypothetical protein